jgi:hypothetical protein
MKTMSQPQHEAQQAPRPRARKNRSMRLYAVDALVMIAFVAVLNVPLTGLAIHEWLGIVLGVGLIVHTLQHTKWITTTTRRFLSWTSFQNRVNYLVMVGIFFGFVSITISGLLISEVALPWIGLNPRGGSFFLWLHLSSVGWVIWLTAIHLAVNWRWIVSTTDRLVFKRFTQSANSR